MSKNRFDEISNVWSSWPIGGAVRKCCMYPPMLLMKWSTFWIKSNFGSNLLTSHYHNFWIKKFLSKFCWVISVWLGPVIIWAKFVLNLTKFKRGAVKKKTKIEYSTFGDYGNGFFFSRTKGSRVITKRKVNIWTGGGTTELPLETTNLVSLLLSTTTSSVLVFIHFLCTIHRTAIRLPFGKKKNLEKNNHCNRRHSTLVYTYHI